MNPTRQTDLGTPASPLDEIAELTPTFAGVSFKFLDEVGSV